MSFSIWYLEETHKAARSAFDQLIASAGSTELYLYAKPGAIRVAPEKPEGFDLGSLVTGERVPGHLTVEQLTYWIRTHTDRFPCLPNE